MGDEAAAGGEGAAQQVVDDKKIVHTYGVVRMSEWPEESWSEVVEWAMTACEKYSANYDLAAKSIKAQLDQRFIAPWNIVVGEAYGWEISYFVSSLMLMFCCGNIAVLCWKAPVL